MDYLPKKRTKERYTKRKKKTSSHTYGTEPTANLNESLSSCPDEHSLSHKEGMRQVLDECQEQLSALTSMVQKIEVGVEESSSQTSTKHWKNHEKIKIKASKQNEGDSTSGIAQKEQLQHQPLHYFVSSHTCRSTGRSKRKQSIRRDSIHSCLSFNKKGMEDGVSVMSHASRSLHSVSHSVKSLPREIELMDEDEDEDNDNYSFFDDSYRSGLSYPSRRSKGSIRRYSAVKSSEDDFSYIDSQSMESHHTSYNASTDTIQVEGKEIVDPYGEIGVYSGALSKSTSMPNGRGHLEYHKDRRWCEGDWIHGRLTGYGRLSNGAGDYYEGGLKNDHFHGIGVMRFDNGRVFEGTYIKGQMVQGKMSYQDGSIYDGCWVDCARHGHGMCIFGDGSKYEGEFREGHFHGHGEMTWNDGGYYAGDWREGKMHGYGKEVRPNGTIRHEGEWSCDQPVRYAKNR